MQTKESNSLNRCVNSSPIYTLENPKCLFSWSQPTYFPLILTLLIQTDYDDDAVEFWDEPPRTWESVKYVEEESSGSSTSPSAQSGSSYRPNAMKTEFAVRLRQIPHKSERRSVCRPIASHVITGGPVCRPVASHSKLLLAAVCRQVASPR